MTSSPVQRVDMTQTPVHADPRPAFAAALDRTVDVLRSLKPDDRNRPTPCAEYDVEQLTAHIVAVVRRVAAFGRGDDPFSVAQLVAGLRVEDAAAQFLAARAEQEAVWADDAVLGRMLVLPFATLPGAISLAIYVSEVTVHTWDLATALGVRVDWDDDVVGGALFAMEQALPASQRGADNGVPFGDVVPTADDAPAIDRLVAWVGRDPSWAV